MELDWFALRLELICEVSGIRSAEKMPEIFWDIQAQTHLLILPGLTYSFLQLHLVTYCSALKQKNTTFSLKSSSSMAFHDCIMDDGIIIASWVMTSSFQFEWWHHRRNSEWWHYHCIMDDDIKIGIMDGGIIIASLSMALSSHHGWWLYHRNRDHGIIIASWMMSSSIHRGITLSSHRG